LKLEESFAVGDIVWVKYGRYSECVWPGQVLEQIDDEVEVMVCRQQSLEDRSAARSVPLALRSRCGPLSRSFAPL
jgi:uncharacterized protein YifN (PemK superfamily)